MERATCSLSREAGEGWGCARHGIELEVKVRRGALAATASRGRPRIREEAWGRSGAEEFERFDAHVRRRLRAIVVRQEPDAWPAHPVP